MTYEEVVSEIEGANLHVIRVEEIDDSHSNLEFSGELHDYLKAAKALHSEVVFVSVMSLSESTFLPYVSEKPNEYEEFDDKTAELEFDLCKLLPELGKFRKMIGVPGQFDFLVPNNSRCLKFTLIEDWWVKFVECFSEARLLAEKRFEDLKNERKEKEQVERSKILSKLHKLISDKDFGRLPTQIAMRAYALEKIPELEDIDEFDLKQEIQSLKARIQARG